MPLYVVATPIGNLGDLTARARSILETVAIVAAEDTRRARILLDHIGVRPTVLSLHAHSPSKRVDDLVRNLEDGTDVAVITDAGTPVVSDPGLTLVHRAMTAHIPVIPVPGPSAVTAALSVAGFSADAFLFLGFLPRRGTRRTHFLEEVHASTRPVVLFEAPQRIADLLADLAAVAGPERRATVARELTKVHEEVRHGTLLELEGYYRSHSARGEFTVVVGGRSPEKISHDDDEVVRRAHVLLSEGKTKRDTVAVLVDELGIPKNRAYRIVTSL